MILGIDTETTGLDLHHGAKPFLVTTCDEDGNQLYWEWPVNPRTRQPEVDDHDLNEIQETIDKADLLVFQNSKFDVQALQTIFYGELRFPWDKCHDTLIAAHLIGSNEIPRDLTTQVVRYLSTNIQPYEDRMRAVVNKARSIARLSYPSFRIAKEGLPEMPSAKAKVWKFDTWLPKAMLREVGDELDLTAEDRKRWETATLEYALADPAVTVALFLRQQEIIRERGLEKIYQERAKIPQITYEVERAGVTGIVSTKNELEIEYVGEVEKHKAKCVEIAKTYGGYNLTIPKGANNKSLTDFAFKVANFPVILKSKKTGSPSLTAKVLEKYQTTLDDARQREFAENLAELRKRTTAISYMKAYERFWLIEQDDYFRLYPTLNPTGTDTLRWSSKNPNEQNISKRKGFNLRRCFGPHPDREWWSLDAKNLELRIPAYEVHEDEMIAVFERPDEPPYYGSTHLLNFHTVYPDVWDEAQRLVGFEKVGAYCKNEYESTWYQWCKNGGFAVQYGSIEESGTADRAFNRPGSFAKLKQRFKRIHGPGGLNERQIEHARKYGYVETIPDIHVDPERGYPLVCPYDQWGKIKPTVPLNYHVQGTACWWIMKAMIRVREYLKMLNSKLPGGYWMVIQVHDELVFDFPRGTGPEPWKTNLTKIKSIKNLMERGGDDIQVPTPVSVEYHSKTWADGLTLAI